MGKDELVAPEPSIRDQMLSLRSKLLAEHPEIKVCGDLAPLMGEFEREYWEWVLDKLEAELDAAGLPPAEPQCEETVQPYLDNTWIKDDDPRKHKVFRCLLTEGHAVFDKPTPHANHKMTCFAKGWAG